MKSELFDQANLEVEGQRFSLQNPQLLRVALGDDVLAVKGAMVAYQGQVRFDHEKAGGVGKLLKKMVTNEDMPLMRVSGQGEVFFAKEAGHVFLVQLDGDAISVNGHNLLAFDASMSWDINRVKGAGMMAGGLFNTTVTGTGTAALCAVGTPVVLDCSQQPTFVDVQACVAWSAGLTPNVVSSMNVKSMLRGGSGEAFQYAFHGPGFVVVQPSEWSQAAAQAGQKSSGGGLIGDLIGS
ncbi:MAG TPA: AIM24 family protein [Nocardioidaceae bacterium]|nr:AIM24 family protein [Nocardioidaceae bacterium]